MAEEIRPLAYSIDDAATMLGLSKRTVYNLFESGDLVSFRVGSRRLVAHAELERFVREREKASENPPLKALEGDRG